MFSNRAAIALLALLANSVAWAQAQLQAPAQQVTREQVAAPPPTIEFAPWKKLGEPVGGIEYLETYPSAFESAYPENNTVPLLVFVPETPEGPVPVVLITHYWGATDLRAERSLATDLISHGIGAAILTLPYHLARTPAGYRSGQLAIQPDPLRLQQMMLQSELDVRRALDFLDTRPEFLHGRFGLVGTSLGAVVSGLAYALDPRVRYASFVLGGVNLSHIIWNSSRVVTERDVLRRRGWTEGKLRDALAAVEPLNYLPREAEAQTFVIYGKYDTVVPHESTQELIDKLPNPRQLQLDTGHYGGIFVERKVLRTVAEFFTTEMAGKHFAAPLKLSAPTIRVGGLLSFPQGADLGIGIDFLHFDREGSQFGTVFATPRGIRVYLGQRISQGLSVGVLGSGSGVGVGLLWSIVL